MDKNDILRFDISVKDFMFMHKSYGLKKVPNDERGAFFS